MIKTKQPKYKKAMTLLQTITIFNKLITIFKSLKKLANILRHLLMIKTAMVTPRSKVVVQVL
jgi:hypothetical protein